MRDTPPGRDRRRCRAPTCYTVAIVDESPLVIAHRGASGTFPENTMAAFRGALEQGADGVELDVRRTADGGLVVVHDGRFADGRLVHEVDLADVPDGVPDLASVLDACRTALVNIEIKSSPRQPGSDRARAVADGVVELVHDRGAGRRVVVSSFDLATVGRVRELDPALTTGWLVGAGVRSRIVERCSMAGHRYLHPWDRMVTAKLVERAHARGIGVIVWTVDDPVRIAQLAGWGVDAVITNHPALALDALDPAR